MGTVATRDRGFAREFAKCRLEPEDGNHYRGEPGRDRLLSIIGTGFRAEDLSEHAGDATGISQTDAGSRSARYLHGARRVSGRTTRRERSRDHSGETVATLLARRSARYCPLFGIAAHGFWTAREDVEPRLFVLASYAAGEDPGEVARRYMQSTEFADDIRNSDVSDIVGVESTILIPSTSSPLR